MMQKDRGVLLQIHRNYSHYHQYFFFGLVRIRMLQYVIIQDELQMVLLLTKNRLFLPLAPPYI